jgi:hypothetical protein
MHPQGNRQRIESRNARLPFGPSMRAIVCRGTPLTVASSSWESPARLRSRLRFAASVSVIIRARAAVLILGVGRIALEAGPSAGLALGRR